LWERQVKRFMASNKTWHSDAWSQFRVFEEKLVTANQVAKNELSSCCAAPAHFTGTP